MEDLVIVDYKTFIQHIEKGGVAEVKFYKGFGQADTSYVYLGAAYATRGPYGTSDDVLLHTTLDHLQIDYTILDQEISGVDDPNAFGQNLVTGIMILVPLALIIVIVLQSLSIKSMSKALANRSQD